MHGIPEGFQSATFSKTVGNTCFMFHTISSVMLFVSVSSACTLMFLVFESMLASYFVVCYVWSCVMFEERFTLCFKVVGESSNVEICFIFFRVCWSPGLASFPFASKVLFFFLAVLSLISISHFDVAKRYCNEKKLEIQDLHNVYKVQFHKGCFIFKILYIH